MQKLQLVLELAMAAAAVHFGLLAADEAAPATGVDMGIPTDFRDPYRLPLVELCHDLAQLLRSLKESHADQWILGREIVLVPALHVLVK